MCRSLVLALAILALTSAQEYDMLDHADSNQDSQYMSPHYNLQPNPHANLRALEQQEQEDPSYLILLDRSGGGPEEKVNRISIPMYGGHGGSGYGGGNSAGIITLSSSSSASFIPTAHGSGHGSGYGGAGYGGGHGLGYGGAGHGGGFGGGLFQHGTEGLIQHGGNVLKGQTHSKGYGGYNREGYGSNSRIDNARDSNTSSSEKLAEAARYQNLLNYHKAQRNANAPGSQSSRNENTPSSNLPGGYRYSPKPDYLPNRPSSRPYSSDSEAPKYPTRQVPSYSTDTRQLPETDKYPYKYVRNFNEDSPEVLKKIKPSSNTYKTRPRV